MMSIFWIATAAATATAADTTTTKQYHRSTAVLILACVRERSFNVAVHEINGTMNQKIQQKNWKEWNKKKR